MNSNTVTDEMIDKIVEETEFKVQTVYGKTTIVSAKLPNGFILTESSSCVDPANYNENIGFTLCKAKIVSKLWELEGYKLQDEIYRKSQQRDMRDYTIRELINNGCEGEVNLEPRRFV